MPPPPTRLSIMPRPTIVPTGRVVAMLAGLAPVGLVVATLAPVAWVAVPVLAIAVLGLALIDGMLAGRLLDARVLAPAEVEIGRDAEVTLLAEIAGRAGTIAAALAMDERLAPGGRLIARLTPAGDGTHAGAGALTPTQRCTGAVDRLWLRWTGPLGLGARQATRDVDAAIRVLPNVTALRSPSLQAFLRDSEFGLIARRWRGEGTVFETLSEYQSGMDRRRIDWKVSARHAHLYAKEYEAERNNQIVFAIDCGQAMCEPVAGLPRLDRAVSAALTTGWVAVKGGDKVALFGFAANVVLSTPFVQDTRDFHRLRSAAAGLDYAAREPNFTLALATLAQRLQRRSLIVVFSDFTDPTSAELMVESIGRLVARHRVVFVTMRDAELDSMAADMPDTIDALAMAVTADTLLRQRALVTRRLRALGVDVVEAPHEAMGMRLLDAYLAIKGRGGIG